MVRHFHFIPVLYMLLLSFTAEAQQPFAIAINWQNKEVVINQASLTKNSSLKDIQKVLGKENRVLSEEGNPIKLAIYDSLGITFMIDAAQDELHRITIHPNQGRMEYETSPKAIFMGNLFIGAIQIAANETVTSIVSRTGIPFKQVAEGYPWYAATNEEFSMRITYQPWNRKLFSSIYVSFVAEKNEDAGSQYP